MKKKVLIHTLSDAGDTRLLGMGRDRCVGGRCVLRRAGGGVRWSISWTDDAVEEGCEDTYGAVSGRFPRIGSAIVTVLLLDTNNDGKARERGGFW